MKIFKRPLLILAGLVIFFAVRYIVQMLPVLSGYAAKVGCSCVFVGQRTPESIQDNELANFPQSFGAMHINLTDSSVTGSVLGLAKRKAIYRKDLGCTLVVEISEEEIKKQQIPGRPTLTYDPDTLLWPTGNIVDSSKLQAIEYAMVRKVVYNSFEEKNPQSNL